MSLTHNTNGSVVFENSKAGTAVAPLRADGTLIDGAAPSVLGTGINVAATALDAGAEASTDEAIASAAAGTRFMGFSCKETAGAVATISFHNGTSNGDATTYVVNLNAGESRGEWFGPEGIASAAGIWLQRITGTTQVIGYFKVVA